MTGVRPQRAFQIVVAATRTWGIGNKGDLPFSLPGKPSQGARNSQEQIIL
jgi:hypothetical protein